MANCSIFKIIRSSQLLHHCTIHFKISNQRLNFLNLGSFGSKFHYFQVFKSQLKPFRKKIASFKITETGLFLLFFMILISLTKLLETMNLPNHLK